MTDDGIQWLNDRLAKDEQRARDRFGNEYTVPKGGRPRTLEPSDYDMVAGSARVVYDPKHKAWHLPGQQITASREAAFRAAELMNFEMSKGGQ